METTDRWTMRCAAETLPDVARLILAVAAHPLSRGSMMSPEIWQGSDLSPVRVAWLTMMPEARMREIIAKIPDGHQMLDTLVYDEVFASSRCGEERR